MGKLREKIRTVKIHGWTGEGPTIAAAKADAIGRIEAAAGGPSYAPRVITFKGHTAVITRDINAGWEHFLIDDTGRPFGAASANPGALHIVYGQSNCRGAARGGWEDLANAERSARSHMAQNAFTVGTDPTAVAGLILNDEDRREFLGWAIWQNACKAFRDARPDGYADADMRAYGDRVRGSWLYGE